MHNAASNAAFSANPPNMYFTCFVGTSADHMQRSQNPSLEGFMLLKKNYWLGEVRDEGQVSDV